MLRLCGGTIKPRNGAFKGWESNLKWYTECGFWTEQGMSVEDNRHSYLN